MNRKIKKGAKVGGPKLRFVFVTIFPDIFDSYLNESLLKRAQADGLVEIEVINLRDFSENRHHKVDDKPFGGGPGMVLEVGPIHQAVKSIMRQATRQNRKMRIVLPSTRGATFDEKIAKRLTKYQEIVFICGRYEGVDERVAEHIADEEISLGDFVLSGGELPALVIMETVCRFLPRFLGKRESREDIRGSYPAYTRPEVFSPGRGQRSWRVPPVLLSGDHAAIEKWRKANNSGSKQ